jgi:uncharacterized protein
VAFHWSEANHPAFANKTETLRAHELALKHRDENGHPRCIMLDGDIGRSVTCSIYPHRPSPCRDLIASLEDGHTRNLQCDHARERHGLAPLTPRDWDAFRT